MISERRINRKGYVEIKVDKKWILEHIYIIEQFIKRKLKKEEKVHHLDEDKKNNLLENLMIFPNQSEHQKFHNLIKQFGWTRYRLEEVKHRWKNYK